MALKEEREVLTEIDVKNQYEDLLDFTTGEKSFVVHRLKSPPHEKQLKREGKKVILLVLSLDSPNLKSI